MADLHWRTVRKQLPTDFPCHIKVAERRIEFANGAELAFRSADNPDHLRGVGLDFLVVDEAAFIPNGGACWAEALRPTLADRLGRALIISTPNGRDWFHDLWLRGQQGDDEFASFRYATADNPTIAPGEVAAAARELPERIFAQEYEAEFLDDGGGVFHNVRRSAQSELCEPYAGHFVMGVDWGKRNDFTVLVVLDVDASRVVALERFNQIDYALQTQRLTRLCERWRPGVVQAEQNSMGDPLIEQLVRQGLPVKAFKTTAASKTRVVDALALAFDREEIALPDDPVLLTELEAFSMTPTRFGNFRYGAPPGLHDDCVMALALAWDARGVRPSAVLAEYL